MRAIQATRILSRAVSTSARTRSSVSMKESLLSAKGGGTIPKDEGYQAMRKLQMEWEKSPEVVWLKRGAVDKFGYTATMILTGLTFVVCLKSIWDMSWPKPAE